MEPLPEAIRVPPAVINAGIPGHNSRDLLARLDEALAHRPTLVVLKVGTNDSLNSYNLVPPDEFAANLELLAARIVPRAALLLATPLPYHAVLHGSRHDPAAFAGLPPAERHALAIATLRAVATRNGLPLVDLHAVVAGCGGANDHADCLLRNPANSGAPDGVHPTAAGYRVIAAAVFAAIRALNLPAARVVCLGDSITHGQHVVGEGTVTGETYPAVLARMLES